MVLIFDKWSEPAHLTGNLRSRNTAFRTSHDADDHKSLTLPLLGWIQPERQPQFRPFGEIETSRHDPNHERHLSIQPNGLSDNGRIATEPALPKGIAQHNGQIRV